MEKAQTDICISKLYPAIYRPSIVRKILAVTLLLACLIGVWGILFSIGIFSPKVWIGGAAVSGLLCYAFISFFISKVILYEDRIENIDGFTKATMRRDEVAGFKLLLSTSRGGISFVPALIYKNDANQRFLLPQWIKKDAAWDAWMTNIPDLTPASDKKLSKWA